MNKKEELDSVLDRLYKNNTLTNFEMPILMGILTVVSFGNIRVAIIVNIVINCIFTLYTRKKIKEEQEFIFVHIGITGIQTQISFVLCGLGGVNSIYPTDISVYIDVIYIFSLCIISLLFYNYRKRKLESIECRGKANENEATGTILRPGKGLMVITILIWVVLLFLFGNYFDGDIVLTVASIGLLIVAYVFGLGWGSIYNYKAYKRC
ncbi:MAG: hypothetical protein PHW34_08440 [Hespellia sp.]|nr:hypothetical protein [Hespellia sp.]